MSRLGKKPVPIAKGAKVSIQDHTFRVEGPKGKLEHNVHPLIEVKVDEAAMQVLVTRSNDEKQSKALHGLTRSLVNNLIIGATEGYTKNLEIQGVGYKAEQKGKSLVLSVGYANTISVAIPGDVQVTLEGNKVHVAGADKQRVGQFAAEVRLVRKPEPYKGKGIRYLGEQVKIKPGKAFAGAGAK
jgi:large subunit ribosomal protein L6